MNNIINTATICLHNTNTDCWIIIDDIVYDVTAYIEKHPAGSEIIMNYAGKDASEEFNKTGHSHSAKKLLKTFIIGVTENYDNTIHHEEDLLKEEPNVEISSDVEFFDDTTDDIGESGGCTC